MLSRTVDLREGWVPVGTESFGVNIGLIPTHNAAIEITFNALRRVHSKISCIVDGDPAGLGYANIIHAMAVPGTKILCWPPNWTIEDVLVWLMRADEVAAVTMLSSKLSHFPATMGAFLALLKSADRATGGIKGDMVAYEAIMEVVYEIQSINRRAQNLLAGLRAAVDGVQNPLFIPEVAPRENILIFQP
ncbi:hypothetical protein DYBT9623_05358 [Dyadobacter sp. CECT 9623]|uniref:Uncharacterized protein n=1 Tax=Dyadobacter linearis TaxID=2823330 RepID=A0ABM8UYK6_9BACT|nr:hypothetical protein [Dyadobacter sp. CECT 9623]CAG5074671.1 hypothetical protein DYBT9623_05358 [Dyadobacter sp. CECT 9623]